MIMRRAEGGNYEVITSNVWNGVELSNFLFLAASGLHGFCHNLKIKLAQLMNAWYKMGQFPCVRYIKIKIFYNNDNTG